MNMRWLRSLFSLLIPLLSVLTAVPSWAAIEYVGAQTGSFAGSASTHTINFALTGGSDAAPLVGDFVIVSYATAGSVDKALTITNAAAVDYTLAGAELFGNDAVTTNLRTAYRVMPDPTETAIIVGGDTDLNDAASFTITVFRGVHGTPLEQAAVQGTAANTMIVNPGDITPTTAGTVVYVVGAGGVSTGAVYTSSDLTDFRSSSGSDASDSTIGAGYFVWSSGQFSPATFGGGGTDSLNASYAWTLLAVAPAEVGVTCRGALMLLGVGGC